MVSQSKFFLWRIFALALLLGSTVFAQSPARYTISGQVSDASGRNMAGVQVCAERIAPPDHNLMVNHSGAKRRKPPAGGRPGAV